MLGDLPFSLFSFTSPCPWLLQFSFFSFFSEEDHLGFKILLGSLCSIIFCSGLPLYCKKFLPSHCYSSIFFYEMIFRFFIFPLREVRPSERPWSPWLRRFLASKHRSLLLESFIFITLEEGFPFSLFLPSGGIVLSVSSFHISLSP